MENRTWITRDKSDWGDGPWQLEPDKEQFVDPDTGMPCLIVRNHGGALCGYVGVDDSNLLHMKGYGDCVDPTCSHENIFCESSPEMLLEVHGGITYSDLCMEGPEDQTICHVPAPGEPDPIWWFGFDCAHSGDYCPGYDHRFRAALRDSEDEYRTVGYVKAQCAKLARQLAEFQREVPVG